MKRLTAPAYAKLNLALEVIGRYKNGYHSIETIFQTVTLADEVTVTLGDPGIHLECQDLGLPPEENLACKAALAYYRFIEKPPAVTISIQKKIPVGAGLGGGSADAACVLRILSQMEKPVGRGDLHRLAATVGSDVPFLLCGGTAYGTGRGELCEPLPTPPLTLALLSPPFSISTSWAYQALDQEGLQRPGKEFKDDNKSSRGIREALLRREWDLIPSFLHNSFEPVVFREYPQLLQAKKRLAEMNLKPLLSGSGSSLFFPVPSEEWVKSSWNEIQDTFRSFRLFLVKTQERLS